MGKLEDEIKQKKFGSEHQKAVINVLYTAGWLGSIHARMMKPYGISPQQFNVLRILRGQHPSPASVGLVQERMLDKSSNASRLIDKLKAKQLIERHECSRDRRQVDVLITEKGLELLKEMDKLMDNNKFDKITEAEAAELNRILDKMRD
jgi:DNA-binding MarR family transcriptional regulator